MQLAEPRRKAVRPQRILQAGERRAGFGQDHVEGERSAGVRHFEHLRGGGFAIGKVPGLVHELCLHRRAALRMKGRRVAWPRLELRLPLAVKVDCAGEHQACGTVERARRKQVADLAFGLLIGPLIDGRARILGIFREIGGNGRRVEPRLQRLGEIRLQRKCAFYP